MVHIQPSGGYLKDTFPLLRKQKNAWNICVSMVKQLTHFLSRSNFLLQMPAFSFSLRSLKRVQHSLLHPQRDGMLGSSFHVVYNSATIGADARRAWFIGGYRGICGINPPQ